MGMEMKPNQDTFLQCFGLSRAEERGEAGSSEMHAGVPDGSLESRREQFAALDYRLDTSMSMYNDLIYHSVRL
jgi:hypothetical protein